MMAAKSQEAMGRARVGGIFVTVRREERAARGGTTKAGRHTAAWATLCAAVLTVTHSFVSGAQPPGSQFVQYRASPSFDLRNAIIPKNEIRSGGPPKDGIPALTNPAVIRAQDAAYLNAADRVAGVAIGEEARAYPLKILNYHEVVNDKLGGVPIAVTYCPLCDSVVVFDRRTEAGVREFGVSGLLYNSNVLMYDRSGRPESLWSKSRPKVYPGREPGRS